MAKKAENLYHSKYFNWIRFCLMKIKFSVFYMLEHDETFSKYNLYNPVLYKNINFIYIF